MKFLIATFILGLGVAQAADTGLSADILKIKVYKMAVSTNVDCSNPITVFENNNASYGDVLVNPQFGNGQLADGTYPCVMIEMSDNIKFSPTSNSTSGNCLDATEYTLDVCATGGGQSFQLIGGTTTVACDDTDQRVAMYLSTGTDGSGNNTFFPPGASNYGVNLGNTLDVSGTSTGKFVVGALGKVCDTANGSCFGAATSCQMNPPDFSFSKI